MTFNIIIFAICCGLVAYTYLLYPAILLCLGYFGKGAYEQGKSLTGTEKALGKASVAVVLSAYNEEKHIENRIQNLLAQKHPFADYQIFVGSDGSTDGTADIASQFSDLPQVQVFAFDQNRGKASVLNDLVSKTNADYIVFTDANTVFNEDNIVQLLANFEDDIGVVCGELHIVDSPGSNNSDHHFWKVERLLKQAESNINGMVGANGANYAIRRQCFEALPSNTICDDLLIAMRIMNRGFRCVYTPGAKAEEEQALSVRSEYWRRVRIGTGNIQALAILLSGFKLRGGINWFTFVSHKILRWVAPYLAIIALITNLMLLDEHPIFRYTLWMQIIGYVSALIVWYRVPLLSNLPPIKQLGYLVIINAGLLRGSLAYLKGNVRATWSPTARS